MSAVRRLRAVVVGCLVVWLAVASATPAMAHSQLLSMTPANGATVGSAPGQIVLIFDEDIQNIGSAVLVIGPNGSRFDDGPATILDATVTQRLKPLDSRGRYVVTYRVVSADGHPATATVGFTLSEGSAPSSVPGRASTNTKSSLSPWAVLGLAGLLMAVARIMVLSTRRHRKQEP